MSVEKSMELNQKLVQFSLRETEGIDAHTRIVLVQTASVSLISLAALLMLKSGDFPFASAEEGMSYIAKLILEGLEHEGLRSPLSLEPDHGILQ